MRNPLVVIILSLILLDTGLAQNTVQAQDSLGDALDTEPSMDLSFMLGVAGGFRQPTAKYLDRGGFIVQEYKLHGYLNAAVFLDRFRFQFDYHPEGEISVSEGFLFPGDRETFRIASVSLTAAYRIIDLGESIGGCYVGVGGIRTSIDQQLTDYPPYREIDAAPYYTLSDSTTRVYSISDVTTGMNLNASFLWPAHLSRQVAIVFGMNAEANIYFDTTQGLEESYKPTHFFLGFLLGVNYSLK